MIYAFSFNPEHSGWGGAFVMFLGLIAASLVLGAIGPRFLNYLEERSSIVAEIRQASRERKDRATD